MTSLQPRSPAATQSILTGNLAGIGSMVVWAAGFPAAEVLLDTWSPLALVTGRFLMALAILVPVWLVLDGTRAVRTARWGRGTFVGSIAFGGGAYLMILAQSLTDPVTVAVIAACSPLAGALIELVYAGRRLTLAFGLGLLASVVGGVVAVGQAPSPQLGLGALAAVAACILFAWGSFMTVRDFPDLSTVGRTTIGLAGGLLVTGTAFVVGYLAGWVPAPVHPFDPKSLELLAIYGVGAMALSQFLWIASVGRLGVAVAAFHINIAPFYVMMILLALGGAWSWPQAIGAAIVALGVVLAQR